jgi:hypothetical protein
MYIDTFAKGREIFLEGRKIRLEKRERCKYVYLMDKRENLEDKENI